MLFTVEEVNNALNLLKSDSSPGHGNLDPEHIKYAGEVCKVVLARLFNTVLSLEAVYRALILQTRSYISLPFTKDAAKFPYFATVTAESQYAQI